MKIFRKITWETMKQNRMRTAVTIIGVILSATLFTAVTVFCSSLASFLEKTYIYNSGNYRKRRCHRKRNHSRGCCTKQPSPAPHCQNSRCFARHALLASPPPGTVVRKRQNRPADGELRALWGKRKAMCRKNATESLSDYRYRQITL